MEAWKVIEVVWWGDLWGFAVTSAALVTRGALAIGFASHARLFGLLAHAAVVADLACGTFAACAACFDTCMVTTAQSIGTVLI